MQELAVLASHAMAAQRQFTAVADNVANVNTHGYKKLNLDFQELVSKRNGHATASYVEDHGIAVDYSTGSLETTDNPLDMALSGEGFFAIQTPQGIQYTRRGQFLINSEGTLMTTSGQPVLDNANAPIQFPQDVKDIRLARDGTISTGQGILAQIGVFSFSKKDLGKLERAGDGNYAPALGALPVPVETPVVRQGMLEASNVNAVDELVTMQSASKAYENSISLLRSLEDVESKAIRTLGQMQ